MSDRNRPRTGDPHNDAFTVVLTTGYDRRASFAMGFGRFASEEPNGDRYDACGSGLRHPDDPVDDPEVGKLLATGRALMDMGLCMVREAEERVRELNGTG